MKKIERKGIIYFIRNEVAAHYNGIDNQSDLNLLLLSEFVIDGNKLIKCRYNLEQLIENFMENNCEKES